MLKAVIFDMDGVIVDSEPMHARAAILALRKYNVDISLDYVYQFIGSTTYYMCQKMVEDFKLEASPEEILAENERFRKYLQRTDGPVVIPYVTDLIKNLYDNGLDLMIASSSPASNIEETMDALKIRDYFKGYVSGMQVVHPKPAPDIFLAAAARLGRKPEECIVIEDSSNGVNAAAAAGMISIGYVNPNSGEQDLRKSAVLVEGFGEIDYEFVCKTYRYASLEPENILETKRLLIRELAVSDIDELCRIYREPEVTAFLEEVMEDSETEKEKHKAYIKNVYHFYGYGLWAVCLKDSQRLIGRCGIEYKLLNNRNIYEIGYLLDKDYQGFGYAKECVDAVIKYSFERLHIPKITAVIDKRNLSSIRLAAKAGMEPAECIRKNHHDCVIYEITEV